MSRIELLEKAKSLAIFEQDYLNALKIIDQLLLDDSTDIDAIRLKGNVIDLQESSSDEVVVKDNQSSLKCYKSILEIDPNNTVALIDIGDFWSRSDNLNKAIEYYDKAISLLKNNTFYLSLKDELEEAYSGKLDALGNANRKAEYKKCLIEAKEMCPEAELF